MTEQRRNQLPLEQVITSLVKIETAGDIGLETALQRIGFEILSDLPSGTSDILISVRPILKPNSDATVVLVLSKGGIFHVPRSDGYFKDKEAPPARLIGVNVHDLKKQVQFSFEGVADPLERRFIKLQTGYSREDWGSI